MLFRSAMYEKMSEDMDINCGTIAEGEEKIEEVGQKIFELIVTLHQEINQKVRSTATVTRNLILGK